MSDGAEREVIENVELLNRLTDQFEPAVLYRGIAESNLLDFEKRWAPPIRARLAAISSSEGVAAANIQDWHWDWRAKATSRAGNLATESFALEAAGTTQGLMFTNSASFARVEGQKGADIVYVEYLATAPWNRNGFTPTPLYKGVGRIFVVTAISLSHELGFKGRIGLHSIPQSETFYRDHCGMTALGPDHVADPRGVLSYFEMTAVQATSFTTS